MVDDRQRKMYKEIKSAELFPVEESAVPTTEQDIFSPVQSLQQPEQQQQGNNNSKINSWDNSWDGNGTATATANATSGTRTRSSPKLEKVLLFYSDNTFSEFIPDK